MQFHHAALVLLALQLSGCEKPRESVAQAVIPVVVEVRESVQEVAPTPPPIVEDLPKHDPAITIATALIVRWEITSPQLYERRYRGVICPGGASGPTWGIGWDGGHQTAQTNREAWSAHKDVDRLSATAGIVGGACKPRVQTMRDIVTAYAMAEEVFGTHGLPRYAKMAERKYGVGINDLPPGARAALWSETYNRGSAIRGTRGAEQARIRDVCIPNNDVGCIADALRDMCRLWKGTVHDPGLCNRRNDEARVAEEA